MKTNSRIYRKWQTPIALLALSALAKRYRNLGIDIAKIKATIFYLQGVKRVRQFSIYSFQILFAALLLIVGIVLFEVTLVFFLPMSRSSQLLAMLGIGFFDLLVASGMLVYLFSGKRWLRDALSQNKSIERWFKETWHES